MAQSIKRGDLADEPMVDIAKADPSIVIDLRYATERNITGHPIYPPGTPCMLRSGVADRLKVAQAILMKQGYRLKIWDAYRPVSAHQVLWDMMKNPEIVADPAKGGSIHSWGAAVDATLVDLNGKDVPMPTDFDDFTVNAKMIYVGTNPVMAKNLHALQNAMRLAGFLGMRDEWWHFNATNWRSYKAISAIETTPSVSPTPVASTTPTVDSTPAQSAVPLPVSALPATSPVPAQ